jgi:hypothetical protein
MKPKKCKYCKQPFIPDRPLQQVCCYSHAIELKKLQDKKDWKKEKKVLKEKIKTKSDLKNELQPLINRIARLIDNNQPCIATGNLTGKRNGGHYISCGANDTIRFNLHNIHIQSEHSNKWRSGDSVRYKDGLIKIYGQDYFNFVDSLRLTDEIHLSKEDIAGLIPKARMIIKGLLKENLTYSFVERIILRNKYNLELGVYEIKYCVFQ